MPDPDRVKLFLYILSESIFHPPIDPEFAIIVPSKNTFSLHSPNPGLTTPYTLSLDKPDKSPNRNL
jgi:hypothetical protein